MTSFKIFFANNFSFKDIFFSNLTFGLITNFFFSTNSSFTGYGDFSSFFTSAGAWVASSS